MSSVELEEPNLIACCAVSRLRTSPGNAWTLQMSGRGHSPTLLDLNTECNVLTVLQESEKRHVASERNSRHLCASWSGCQDKHVCTSMCRMRLAPNAVVRVGRQGLLISQQQCAGNARISFPSSRRAVFKCGAQLSYASVYSSLSKLGNCLSKGTYAVCIRLLF
eukprot:2791428-Amphidinium_carterae.1